MPPAPFKRRLRLALAVAITTSPAIVSSALAAPSLVQATNERTLPSVGPGPRVPAIDADIRLLHHVMRGVDGRPVPATTLLLVPKGKPPVGGWPIVAWEHGTTTPGQKACAPSRSADLDGGLTTAGLTSDYAWQIGRFVKTGYAVVAPDLEGLGPDATTPNPYYNLSSLARSLVAGVVAAREADPALSNRWVAVGQSEGGHGVLGVERHADEAKGTTFLGTIAIAPYVGIVTLAAKFGSDGEAATTSDAQLQGRMMQQFTGALMATGLKVSQPSFDVSTIMGPDLAATLSRFRASCSGDAIALMLAAIKSKGTAFRGLSANWAAQPDMRAFLRENDPVEMPGFALRRPTLIVQGTADTFVLEGLQTAFADKLVRNGSILTYKTYKGADHFTVMRAADADVLAFARQLFAR